jgi:hypothetical protein
MRAVFDWALVTLMALWVAAVATYFISDLGNP